MAKTLVNDFAQDVSCVIWASLKKKIRKSGGPRGGESRASGKIGIPLRNAYGSHEILVVLCDCTGRRLVEVVEDFEVRG